MTRNTISNTMSSIGILLALFAVGAATHYDNMVMGAWLFANGAALFVFAPSTK